MCFLASTVEASHLARSVSASSAPALVSCRAAAKLSTLDLSSTLPARRSDICPSALASFLSKRALPCLSFSEAFCQFLLCNSHSLAPDLVSRNAAVRRSTLDLSSVLPARRSNNWASRSVIFCCRNFSPTCDCAAVFCQFFDCCSHSLAPALVSERAAVRRPTLALSSVLPVRRSAIRASTEFSLAASCALSDLAWTAVFSQLVRCCSSR